MICTVSGENRLWNPPTQVQIQPPLFISHVTSDTSIPLQLRGFHPKWMYVKLRAPSPVMAKPSDGRFPSPSYRCSISPGAFLYHIPVLRAVSGHVYRTWVIVNPPSPPSVPFALNPNRHMIRSWPRHRVDIKRTLYLKLGAQSYLGVGGGFLTPTVH